jgi:hypothetical protein
VTILYRRDHIALAKAVRDAAATTGIEEEAITVFAMKIGDVCSDRTTGTAKFDRELFMAYALSPALPE